MMLKSKHHIRCKKNNNILAQECRIYQSFRCTGKATLQLIIKLLVIWCCGWTITLWESKKAPTLLKHNHSILFNNNANGFISFQKLQFFFASSFFPSDAVDAPSQKSNPRRHRHFASINTQYYSIIMPMASFPFKKSAFTLHHVSF